MLECNIPVLNVGMWCGKDMPILSKLSQGRGNVALLLWSLYVPHLYCFVSACRSDARAIRGPLHSIHLVRMTAIGPDLCPCRSVPYLHCPISTCRCNPCTIWRPGHCLHISAMPLIRQNLHSRRCIPYLYSSFINAASRCNARAIWRPSYRCNVTGMIFISQKKHSCDCIPYMHLPIVST